MKYDSGAFPLSSLRYRGALIKRNTGNHHGQSNHHHRLEGVSKPPFGPNSGVGP